MNRQISDDMARLVVDSCAPSSYEIDGLVIVEMDSGGFVIMAPPPSTPWRPWSGFMTAGAMDPATTVTGFYAECRTYQFCEGGAVVSLRHGEIDLGGSRLNTWTRRRLRRIESWVDDRVIAVTQPMPMTRRRDFALGVYLRIGSAVVAARKVLAR